MKKGKQANPETEREKQENPSGEVGKSRGGHKADHSEGWVGRPRPFYRVFGGSERPIWQQSGSFGKRQRGYTKRYLENSDDKEVRIWEQSCEKNSDVEQWFRWWYWWCSIDDSISLSLLKKIVNYQYWKSISSIESDFKEKKKIHTHKSCAIKRMSENLFKYLSISPSFF